MPLAEAAAGMPSRSLRRRLPAGVIQEVVSRYDAGEETPLLCKEYGVSKGGLLKLLREEGVRLRRQPLADGVVAEAARLYESGLSLTRVAERLGVSRESLRRGLLDAGVVMRSRGGRSPMSLTPMLRA